MSDETVRITCGACAKTMRAPVRMLGKQVKCPQCQSIIEVVPTPVAIEEPSREVEVGLPPAISPAPEVQSPADGHVAPEVAPTVAPKIETAKTAEAASEKRRLMFTRDCSRFVFYVRWMCWLWILLWYVYTVFLTYQASRGNISWTLLGAAVTLIPAAMMTVLVEFWVLGFRYMREVVSLLSGIQQSLADLSSQRGESA